MSLPLSFNSVGAPTYLPPGQDASQPGPVQPTLRTPHSIDDAVRYAADWKDTWGHLVLATHCTLTETHVPQAREAFRAWGERLQGRAEEVANACKRGDTSGIQEAGAHFRKIQLANTSLLCASAKSQGASSHRALGFLLNRNQLFKEYDNKQYDGLKGTPKAQRFNELLDLIDACSDADKGDALLEEARKLRPAKVSPSPGRRF